MRYYYFYLVLLFVCFFCFLTEDDEALTILSSSLKKALIILQVKTILPESDSSVREGTSVGSADGSISSGEVGES